MSTSETPPDHAATFGIKTSPIRVACADILRVWREADAIPEIGHAWLFDHLLPIFRLRRRPPPAAGGHLQTQAGAGSPPADHDRRLGRAHPARDRVPRGHLEHPRPPAHDLAELERRSRMFEEACAEVGRDSRTIRRSVQIGVAYDDLTRTLADTRAARAAGFTHVVLALSAPYPDRIAATVSDRIILPAST